MILFYLLHYLPIIHWFIMYDLKLCLKIICGNYIFKNAEIKHVTMSDLCYSLMSLSFFGECKENKVPQSKITFWSWFELNFGTQFILQNGIQACSVGHRKSGKWMISVLSSSDRILKLVLWNPQPEKRKKESILDLSKYLEKGVRIKFAGGRECSGILKGYDPLLNIVVDNTVEYLRWSLLNL